MNYITKVLLRMGGVLTCVIGAVTWLHKIMIDAVNHNIWLNGLIFFVIFFGIFINFRQILKLRKEQLWIDDLSNTEPLTHLRTTSLTILAPFAYLIEEGNLPSYISPINAQTILTTIGDRLHESREVARYCIGLLVFLGLLGTFWGLTQTVMGISGVIGTLDINGADTKSAFQTLKQGLNAPLMGMGTAFSCSMFGLAGSLLIGFLDLQVGRASTIFYNQIEEELSKLTRFTPFTTSQDASGASLGSPFAGSAFSLSLLEQAIEGMAALYEQLKKSEDSRLTMTKSVQVFSEKLSEMSEYIMAHQGFSQRLAQHQIELQEIMIQNSKDGNSGRSQEIIKTHLRSIDASLAKLLEETIEGRNKGLQEIRQEIRFVTRTLSAIANGQDISS